MTREEKIRLAEQWAEAGVTNVEISRRLGVTPSCVSKWLNPERTREWYNRANAKSNDRKRRWERSEAGRGRCSRCGGLQGIGSSHRDYGLCSRCVREEVEVRRSIIIAGYETGKLPRDIALEAGCAEHTVKQEASRLRKSGIPVPFAARGGSAHR